MEDIAKLEAESERIAALRADPRTPGVVRRAWLRPGALTLRRFLALEEAGSPVLTGRWPLEDAEAMATAFCQSWAILWPERDVPQAVDLQRSMEEMSAEVSRGFSTVMPMRFPKVGSDGASPSQDGLGWVARLVARFPDPDAVLDRPLDQTFILAAAMSANEGADCVGEDYRERSVLTGVVGKVVGSRVAGTPEDTCPQHDEHAHPEKHSDEEKHRDNIA